MTKRPPNHYARNPLLGTRPKRSLKNDEIQERLLALCVHHGIAQPLDDPMALAKLAYCLAITHVPGFRPQRRRGRPIERSASDMYWAMLDFCRLKRELRLDTDHAVIRHMARDPYYIEIGFGSDPKGVRETLRYMLQRAREPDFAKQMLDEGEKFMAALIEVGMEAPGRAKSY